MINKNQQQPVKQGLIASYVDGIKDLTKGEQYSTLMRYFSQEFVSAAILYSVLLLVDAYFVSHINTSAYATLGVSSTLLHFIVKMAEGLSVGVVVLTGQFNGLGKYRQVGRVLIDSFWTTCILGATIASMLYFGAYYIYKFYGVPEDMIRVGIPFLRLRALAVFFTFVYFGFLGFLRGIKNTKTPMKIFMVGGVFYIFFDYALIFGNFGFPAFGFLGSAMASVIQYGVMFFIAVGYLILKKDTRKYISDLTAVFKERSYVRELISLSWPVVVEKALFASGFIWLCAMVAPMGKYVLATFSVIKDMERIAILPGIAFAQVLTFLVSNDFGRKNWDGIKANLKKVLFLTSMMVFSVLLLFSLFPEFFVSFFDRRGEFTHLAARIFPLLSVLIIFDVIQLVLAGALRGAANVKTVMATRLVVLLGYFVPVSYMLSKLPIQDQALKFVLIYGSFYVGNAFMSLAYIHRLRGEAWKKQIVE